MSLQHDSKYEIIFRKAAAVIYIRTLRDNFVASAPIEQQNRAGDYHLEPVLGTDHVHAKSSAHAIGQAAIRLLSLDSTSVVMDIGPIADADRTNGLLQSYYDIHSDFIPENYILDNADSIRILVSIVQGRYGCICLPLLPTK